MAFTCAQAIGLRPRKRLRPCRFTSARVGKRIVSVGDMSALKVLSVRVGNRCWAFHRVGGGISETGIRAQGVCAFPCVVGGILAAENTCLAAMSFPRVGVGDYSRKGLTGAEFSLRGLG